MLWVPSKGLADEPQCRQLQILNWCPRLDLCSSTQGTLAKLRAASPRMYPEIKGPASITVRHGQSLLYMHAIVSRLQPAIPLTAGLLHLLYHTMASAVLKPLQGYASKGMHAIVSRLQHPVPLTADLLHLLHHTMASAVYKNLQGQASKDMHATVNKLQHLSSLTAYTLNLLYHIMAPAMHKGLKRFACRRRCLPVHLPVAGWLRDHRPRLLLLPPGGADVRPGSRGPHGCHDAPRPRPGPPL